MNVVEEIFEIKSCI